MNILIEREYQCNSENCDGFKFIVLHEDRNSRNKFCSCCGAPIIETGIVTEVEDGMLVTRLNGEIINKQLTKNKDLFK